MNVLCGGTVCRSSVVSKSDLRYKMLYDVRFFVDNECSMFGISWN